MCGDAVHFHNLYRRQPPTAAALCATRCLKPAQRAYSATHHGLLNEPACRGSSTCLRFRRDHRNPVGRPHLAVSLSPAPLRVTKWEDVANNSTATRLYAPGLSKPAARISSSPPQRRPSALVTALWRRVAYQAEMFPLRAASTCRRYLAASGLTDRADRSIRCDVCDFSNFWARHRQGHFGAQLALSKRQKGVARPSRRRPVDDSPVISSAARPTTIRLAPFDELSGRY